MAEARKDKSKNDEKTETQEQKPPLWPFFIAGIIVAVFVVIVLVVIFAPTNRVWTDDAYISAHYATIAPRISGQIAFVTVTDNQTVRQGQLLALIDDRDYKAALAQAQAGLQADIAQQKNTSAVSARQPAIIAQARSQLVSAQAQLAFARANNARYQSAAVTGADTYQDRQQAETQLRQAEASVAGQQASLEAAEQQLPVLAAQSQAATAQIAAAKAQVRQAELNLSYTRIAAPLDGMIGELSVQTGNYVAPGAALMALVPLQQIYIVANYREIALQKVLPGQPVRIRVDAYDAVLHGVVNSVAPASGAAFSPIEPNNATGNFTKIVQRLPVKITFLPNQPATSLLRIGMSVETTIDTGTQPNPAR